MDHGIENLLMMNGYILDQGHGYLAKFEVSEKEKTPARPHGIKYALTLHNENNERVLGFDNAHAVNKKFLPRFHKKIVEWDHEHKLGNNVKIFPYNYESAYQLLEDFYEEVDKALTALEE